MSNSRQGNNPDWLKGWFLENQNNQAEISQSHWGTYRGTIGTTSCINASIKELETSSL